MAPLEQSVQLKIAGSLDERFIFFYRGERQLAAAIPKRDLWATCQDLAEARLVISEEVACGVRFAVGRFLLAET